MNKSWGIRGGLAGAVVAVGLAATLAIGCDDDDPPTGGTGSAGRGGSTGTGGGGGRTTGAGGVGGTTAGGGTGGTTAGGGTGGTTAGGGGATAALTDPRIGGVMIEANTGEVHAGEIAKSKATSSDVLSFANMMITDHSAATMRLQQLLDQKGMVAEDSAQRQMLSMQATQTLNTLWAAPTASFDVVYMDSQVSMHMMVLQMLDNMLIPSSQDAALKADLQTSRTAVAAHLAHAQQVRAALGGTTP